MFSVSHNTIVATKFKVKFIAKVYVSTYGINISSNSQLIGTFKTTPNNAGAGIFDFRPILETFLTPDYEGSTYGMGSKYKGSDDTHPIHLIDKYALSEDSIRYFGVEFDIEYSDTATGAVIPPSSQSIAQGAPSLSYLMFNGVLQYDDVLTLFQGNYGYFLGLASGNNFYLDNSAASFLTNSPTTQYARVTDYGTLPFLNFLPTDDDIVHNITLTYYDDSDSQIGTETVAPSIFNGGASFAGGHAFTRLMYFGAFPGNLRNWSSDFKALVDAGNTPAYYTVFASAGGEPRSQTYTINILCPSGRGYEGIRLTWLNQWGTWDYYTLNMKSTRSITTQKIPYTQLGGTWNESRFKIAGYKGGKKNFRVNSTEKIKLNTDFVTEEEGVWFEELINSNEVYIVNGYENDVADTITNKYVEPVVLTTSSYVKKTIANDKLMQYTFEIEKSKIKRTQAV